MSLSSYNLKSHRYLVDFQFYIIGVVKATWYNFNLLKYPRLVLCLYMWSILENVLCALKKNAYSISVGWNAIGMFIRSLGLKYSSSTMFLY